MAVYIVTYDLNKETTRPPIVEKINDYDSWARLSESSYAIASSLPPDEIYNDFAPLLDDNDNLYVITLNLPFFGQGPTEVIDWLSDNLG